MPDWNLLFRQVVPSKEDRGLSDGPYPTVPEWRARNIGYSDSQRFSRLSQLGDDLKNTAGKFLFKIVWPRSSVRDGYWEQTSNPMDATEVTGYASRGGGFLPQFQGLARNPSGTSILRSQAHSQAALHYETGSGINFFLGQHLEGQEKIGFYVRSDLEEIGADEVQLFVYNPSTGSWSNAQAARPLALTQLLAPFSLHFHGCSLARPSQLHNL